MGLSPDDLLERSQWDFFWAPADATVEDRPELLYVRCPRDIIYLNAVTRVRAEADRLGALVDEVAAAHAGRRSRWNAPSLAPEIERALARAGYLSGDEHGVYALAPQDYRAGPLRAVLAKVVVRRVGTLDELRQADDVMREAFGEGKLGTRSPDDEARLAHDLALCAGKAPRVARFVAFYVESQAPVATAGLTLFPNLGFGLLWGGGTVPWARGRGAYSALVAARLGHARRAGLRLVGLYARLTTSAPIVARQGFRRHGSMTHWNRVAAT